MELLELMKYRRSIRRYKPDPISETDLKEILEAGLAAPSAINLQHWYFVAVQNPQALDEIKAIIEAILQQLKATMTLGHNGKTFKCIVPVATGQVTVKISVSTVTGDTHLVEFCRLKGSQFDFLRVYRAIKQRLT